MKPKKKIIILSIICIFLCGSVAFGMNNIKHIYEEKSKNINSDNSAGEMINVELLKDSNLIELSKKQGMDADKLQYTMEQFFEIVLMYPINDAELTVIEEMVDGGADLSKIMDIYTFLQSSNASLQYIKDMYYYGENVDFYGRYWIEDAFNYCSGQKEYELSMEDVQKYIDNGLSADDIRIANVVSRSEVKNIQELLEEKQSGKIWGEIINEIYSDIDLSEMQYEENGNTILECIRLSEIADEPIQKMYDNYKEHPQKITNEVVVPKIIEAENIVRELNLNVSDSDTYFNQLKQEIGDTLSDYEIKNLIEQKYTEDEIKKAAVISEIDGIDIESILEDNKVMNNLEIEGGSIDE